jgi:hypothetical protein
LGPIFDEIEMRKIFKEFKLGKRSSAYDMHQKLILLCMTENQVSKHVEKMLKKRFKPYEERIKDLEKEKIVEMIKRGDMDIPISALIWFAVRDRREDTDQIEKEVFAAVHVREHQALRFCDTLSRVLPPGSRVEDVIDELKSALVSNEKLERNLDRSKRKTGQLRSEIDAIKAKKSRLALELEEQMRLNERLNRRWEDLGGDKAFEEIGRLKEEIKFLTGEIKILTEGLLKKKTPYINQDICDYSKKEDIEEEGRIINENIPLKGVKVAFVGGVESLVPHYRDIVRCLGGDFCYHCGRCSVGRREIEELVNKTDVVFCPLDINSHNACRYVKKACKLRNKPCYFLRSSSLTTLRSELAVFAENQLKNEIVEEVSG